MAKPQMQERHNPVSQTSTKTYYPVESGRRLSSSLLWDLQRQFYREQGVNAWSNSLVPHFVSSNAYLAHCYARLIIAYATDVYKSDPSFSYDDPPMNLLKKFRIIGSWGWPWKVWFPGSTKIVATKRFLAKGKLLPIYLDRLRSRHC